MHACGVFKLRTCLDHFCFCFSGFVWCGGFLFFVLSQGQVFPNFLLLYFFFPVYKFKHDDVFLKLNYRTIRLMCARKLAA